MYCGGQAVYSFAWWLSLLIGFLSLSEEILWVRVAGFAYHTLPSAFSFVLALYLVGIALGAALGKRLCGRTQNLYGAAAVVLGVCALGDVLAPLAIGEFTFPGDVAVDLVIPVLAIVGTAALKSVLFPIVHHLGSFGEGPRIGRSVSRIYFGNIIGATLGPLVTGFVALDYLTVDECFGLIAAICLVASTACVFKSTKPRLILVTLAAATMSTAIASKVIHSGPGSLASLAVGGTTFTADITSIIHFVANRHGVIHTIATPQGDAVFGGNVYDGMATVNVDTNPNRLDRLYMLALLKPDAKRVLFVGLSTGAWVRAMQGFPDVERIDVVEINPAYIDLLQSYVQLAPLLHDSRIHIHIDDGRRWLRRNPQTRFDLIVQNTTYYWRANAGNLLSREYLSEVKTHLDRSGIVTMNTTGSFDVLATNQAVFGYAYRYLNFVYASEQPLTPDVDGLWKIRRPDGAFFVRDDIRPVSVAALLANARLQPVEELFAHHPSVRAEIIADDNLVSEYRHGKRFGPGLLQALLPPPGPPEFAW